MYVFLTLVNVELVVCVPLEPAAHSEMLLPSSYSWPPCCLGEGKNTPDKRKAGFNCTLVLWSVTFICSVIVEIWGQGILGESKYSLFFF